MSTAKNLPRILSVDDDPIIHELLRGVLMKDGLIECLDSKKMDVSAAVEAIRSKLSGVDILILDGNYKDTEKTGKQTALQVIQSLSTELSSQGITVIVYSASGEILTAVRTFYPGVSTIEKPSNFDLIKQAIEARVPFQAN